MSCNENIKQDDDVRELLLIFEEISQWLGVHRRSFDEMEVKNYHLNHTTNMHDLLEMIPEET